MADSGWKKQYRPAFVLDKKSIEKLVRILEDAAKRAEVVESPVLFKVTRADGFYWDTESIDDLLRDPNVGDRRVVGLDISLYNTRLLPSFRALIIFDGDGSSIWLSIEMANHDLAHGLFDQLDNALTGMVNQRKVSRWAMFLTYAFLNALFFSWYFDLQWWIVAPH